MMNYLIEIEEKLNQINAPVIKYLKPGVAEDEIKAFFQNIFHSQKLPDNFIELYKWHNGTEINYNVPAADLSIFPTMVLHSLEQIQEIYDSEVDQIYRLKERNFIPLFSDGSGDWILFKLGKKYSNSKASKIYIAQVWNPEFEDVVSIYDDLETMFKTILLCYNENVFFTDEAGLLDKDFDKCWEISKKMNPNSEYWKQM